MEVWLISIWKQTYDPCSLRAALWRRASSMRSKNAASCRRTQAGWAWAGHCDVRQFLSTHVEAGGGGAEALESGAGGASGVGDAEELRGLVERVADGFVEGRGEDSETRGRRGEEEERVSAGDEQGKEREAQVSELRRG